MSRSDCLVWIVYDIRRDRFRRRIARLLEDAGLRRVQKSAFLGRVGRDRLVELVLDVRRFVDERSDSLLVVPTNPAAIEGIEMLGAPVDVSFASEAPPCRVV